MRDAAAKFLVQFLEQSVGERLARNEAVVVEAKTGVSGFRRHRSGADRRGNGGCRPGIDTGEHAAGAERADRNTSGSGHDARRSEGFLKPHSVLACCFILTSRRSRYVTPGVSTGSPFSNRGL